jgi:hypothetical protein
MGYYSGDPGFFSIVKSLGGAALGMVPGVGGVAGRAIQKIGGSRIGGLARRGMEIGRGAIVKHPVLSAAGGAAAVAAAGGMMAGRAGMVPAGRHGFHISRKTGKMVRNRHMRVTNPKALRRALRRAHGFAKLAMKTIHLVHPRKKVRFGGFKHRRKK